jgi:hypothetical protein
MTTREEGNTSTKIAPSEWPFTMWKEIDDETFGKGFVRFTSGCYL